MSSFKDAFIEKYNLPKEESGNYLSYREDDEYFYVDIGRNPEIEAIWSESQARIKALEEKYHQKLLDILADLQEEVKKSSEEKNLSLMPAIAVTPSKGSSTKKAGRNKRPAPPSSSINKLILRRSKRGSGHLQQNVVANSASKLEVKQKMVVEGGNITPAKLTSISTAAFGASTRLQLTPLPATIRRQNIEREKEDKLIASEEKRKKADEKKQDQLKARTQALKEERDARMEKIARNKAALEKKAMEAAAAKGLLPSVSAESQQAAAENGSGAGAGPKRYKLRRQVLATVTSHKPTATAEKPTGPLTRAAKAKAAAEASSSTQPTNNAGDGSSNNSSTAATRPNKSAGKKGGSAKRGSKKLPVSSKKTAATRKAANTTTKKGAATKKATPIEQQQQQPTQPNSNNTPMVFSPIVCENTLRKGVNRRLSETFTSEAANTSGRNSTFAVPQPPSKVPKVVNTTANTTATIAAGSGPHCSTFQAGNSLLLMTPSAAAVTGKGSVVAASASQYEMTPPPKTPSYLTDNYDISKYIDSDDEEAQEAAEKAAEKKPIPQWALGKPFLKQLMRQFGRQSPEEMTAQAERLFIKPRIPVPLEEMGLPVREKYVARSSSVNWKTIAEIECQLKKK